MNPEDLPTIKYGDYTNTWSSTWSVISDSNNYLIPIILIAFILILVLLGIHAAIKHSFGLRFKLASFTVAFTLLLLFMISVPLYYISTGMIRGEIGKNETLLLNTIIVIALIVLIIGIVGSFILSHFIIKPIWRLVHNVERIRDTENKEELGAEEISIKSRDEIAILGAAINNMAQILIKAASTASEVSIGRELQKKLLPLKIDSEGNRLNYGYKDTKNAFFYGYSEGAKVVSGDYFDYQDIDGRYYAIIKCDIAGKGIPAAMLMMQVATMFLNYFKQWNPLIHGTNIEEIVYQINSFIETLGLNGRFAAFSLCLFDTLNGDLHFCNAGDNIIRIFDNAEKHIKKIVLPQTPAAGVFTDDLVRLKGGYHVHTITLEHGDILLLYTDGIEESKRKFNNITSGGNIYTEEFGPHRVEEIINAVMNRKTYSLKKLHNPENNINLQFDFSYCKGYLGELIIALISVEKMFRCYKDTKVTKDDLVLVDKKIDAFLKKTFLQYNYYCSNISECQGSDSHIYYAYLKENEQYDDLTILGVMRK